MLIAPLVEVPILISIMPIEEREFWCLDRRIPVLVMLGNDNVSRSFEVNNPIVVERIFSGIQPRHDIHIFVNEMLFVWFWRKHCRGQEGWGQEHEPQTEPWE